MSRAHLLQRANEYAQHHGLVMPGDQLGAGVHGIVVTAERQTVSGQVALKIHEQAECYRRERDVYLRLREHGINDIHGCSVPEMTGFDDQLLVIQMNVVTRPFCLDFAGAYLDRPPDFSEQVLQDWRAEKQEQFGARWRDIQAILRFLEAHGVFMLDVNPGNIAFVD